MLILPPTCLHIKLIDFMLNFKTSGGSIRQSIVQLLTQLKMALYTLGVKGQRNLKTTYFGHPVTSATTFSTAMLSPLTIHVDPIPFHKVVTSCLRCNLTTTGSREYGTMW